VAIIVCPQPAAAEIGLEVMRRGGNAVDAAVTCAFVQGVLDPQMCGIGGCGVMLVHSATGGDALLEFYSTAGSRAREDQWEHLFIREAADRYGYVLDGWVNDVGYQSVGVPGTVAGLHEALTRFGSITWEQAIEPAIPFARDGFSVTGFMHGYWTTDYGPDVVPNLQRIQATLEARSIYTRDGKLFAIGERMVQADYARTLERLAREGPDIFYKGEIADEIAADFEANGGFITKEDLAGYKVNVTEPLRGTYRGRQVVAAGPPAGGLTLLQMLNFLEGYDLRAHGWPSSEAARVLVEAMAWAMADRELHIADPKFMEIPTGALADKQYAAKAREVVAARSPRARPGRHDPGVRRGRFGQRGLADTHARVGKRRRHSRPWLRLQRLHELLRPASRAAKLCAAGQDPGDDDDSDLRVRQRAAAGGSRRSRRDEDRHGDPAGAGQRDRPPDVAGRSRERSEDRLPG